MKYTIIVAFAALSLGGCASSKVPPPAPAPQIYIPVNLVNYEPTVTIIAADLPSDRDLVHIRKDDPADEALEDVLRYTQDLKTFAVQADSDLRQCMIENTDAHDKLDKIKQYILLRSGQPNQIPQ